MQKLFYTFLFIVCSFSVNAGIYSNDSNSVKTSFIPSHTQVVAGQTFNLLWHFIPEKHWHTYWKNPGDTGFENIINWKLPKGFTVGKIVWPTPAPMLTETVMSYVYKSPSTITIPITVPKNATNNKVFNISADVTFLACAEVCIPIKQNLSTQIIVGNKEIKNPIATELLTARKLPTKINSSEFNIMADGDNFYFRLPKKLGNIKRFIPNQDELILDSAPQKITYKNGAKILSVTRDNWFEKKPVTLSGLLLTNNDSYEIIKAPVKYLEKPAPYKKSYALIWILIFAFIAGLILNLMPCVLPVLALKVLSLIKQSQGKPATYAITYTSGILVSFWALGGLIMFLKASGNQLGWGFHLQSPVFVLLLTMLMLILAFNFFGLFSFGGNLSKFEHSASKFNGLASPFFSGVLVTLVATPCTAPFMGTAVAYALTAPIVYMLLTLTTMGLGLATPFLLLAIFPSLIKFLPKPGKWMNTLKKVLGIPLLLTAIWLGWIFWQLVTPANNLSSDSIWKEWTPTTETQATNQQIVFINATADWCITCKVTENLVFDTDEFKALMRKNNVLLLKADWTKQSNEVTTFIESYGREGVPLYVLKIPHKPAKVLPQFLSLKVFEKEFSTQP